MGNGVAPQGQCSADKCCFRGHAPEVKFSVEESPVQIGNQVDDMMVKPEPVLAVTRKAFTVGVAPGVGSPLGMTISTDDSEPGLLTIDAIWRPGLIADWNTEHDAEVQVCVGDSIASVNSIAGDGRDMFDYICEVLKKEDKSHLRMGIHPQDRGFIRGAAATSRKPFKVELRVTAAQDRMPLGMIISAGDDCSHILIDGVHSKGHIAEWNNSHPDLQKVSAGDRITAINDKPVDGPEMLEVLASLQSRGGEETLTLQIEP